MRVFLGKLRESRGECTERILDTLCKTSDCVLGCVLAAGRSWDVCVRFGAQELVEPIRPISDRLAKFLGREAARLSLCAKSSPVAAWGTEMSSEKRLASAMASIARLFFARRHLAVRA